MKRQINLYTAEFRPQRVWASLNQMVVSWVGCLLLLALVAAGYEWQQHQLGEELRLVQSQLELKRGEAQRLDAELASHQADIRLQQQLEIQREDLAAKRALLQQLGTLALQKSQGYAGLLADLSRIRDPQLSVQRIEVADGHINLAGFTDNSQAVPAWVARFKQTPSLVGKQFGELTLHRDKEGRLVFQLTGIAREKP